MYMIDLLTVNYRNYELLQLQLDHLSKLEGINDHRLIVVENTPKHERSIIDHPLISKIVYIDKEFTDADKRSVSKTAIHKGRIFDGVSHGSAIELGLRSVQAEIVFIFDTDFFVLKKDFFPFFIKKMEQERLDAIGPEFFDGRDWEPLKQRSPENFNGLPIAWGTFFRSEIAKSESWTIDLNQVFQNENEGFVEVGWRIRKKLIERGKNTLTFDGYQKDYKGQGNCYFRYNGEDVAFHYMRASYDRMSQSMQEIKGFIS